MVLTNTFALQLIRKRLKIGILTELSRSPDRTAAANSAAGTRTGREAIAIPRLARIEIKSMSAMDEAMS